ncbi:MAG: acyl carrier protein [Planctomycetaceae bacterium]|jgi:acyl carrier protein|nr:acyl carrier protein [Planctomycetaceae bacterium]
MNQTTIITDIQEIFSDTFDIDGKTVTRETSAKDVKDWDSVAHVILITSIEKKFAIRFTGREIANFKTVGDLIDALEKKMTSDKK